MQAASLRVGVGLCGRISSHCSHGKLTSPPTPPQERPCPTKPSQPAPDREHHRHLGSKLREHFSRLLVTPAPHPISDRAPLLAEFAWGVMLGDRSTLTRTMQSEPNRLLPRPPPPHPPPPLPRPQQQPRHATLPPAPTKKNPARLSRANRRPKRITKRAQRRSHAARCERCWKYSMNPKKSYCARRQDKKEGSNI